MNALRSLLADTHPDADGRACIYADRVGGALEAVERELSLLADVIAWLAHGLDVTPAEVRRNIPRAIEALPTQGGSHE